VSTQSGLSPGQQRAASGDVDQRAFKVGAWYGFNAFQLAVLPAKTTIVITLGSVQHLHPVLSMSGLPASFDLTQGTRSERVVPLRAQRVILQA
jgi:hypothetical protein